MIRASKSLIIGVRGLPLKLENFLTLLNEISIENDYIFSIFEIDIHANRGWEGHYKKMTAWLGGGSWGQSIGHGAAVPPAPRPSPAPPLLAPPMPQPRTMTLSERDTGKLLHKSAVCRPNDYYYDYYYYY